MTSLNLPRSLSNNTTADANHVMDNFNAIKDFTNAEVVRTDGSVKAGTSAIADDAVTTAKIATGAVGTTEIAANAVTQDKLPSGTFLLKYQDYSVGPFVDYYGFYTVTDYKITLPTGVTSDEVVSVVGYGGVNNYVTSCQISGKGNQSLVLTMSELLINASVNHIIYSNMATVRVWYTA